MASDEGKPVLEWAAGHPVVSFSNRGRLRGDELCREARRLRGAIRSTNEDRGQPLWQGAPAQLQATRGGAR
jgi:hypothetical protein